MLANFLKGGRLINPGPAASMGGMGMVNPAMPQPMAKPVAPPVMRPIAPPPTPLVEPMPAEAFTLPQAKPGGSYGGGSGRQVNPGPGGGAPAGGGGDAISQLMSRLGGAQGDGGGGGGLMKAIMSIFGAGMA